MDPRRDSEMPAAPADDVAPTSLSSFSSWDKSNPGPSKIVLPFRGLRSVDALFTLLRLSKSVHLFVATRAGDPPGYIDAATAFVHNCFSYWGTHLMTLRPVPGDPAGYARRIPQWHLHVDEVAGGGPLDAAAVWKGAAALARRLSSEGEKEPWAVFWNMGTFPTPKERETFGDVHIVRGPRPPLRTVFDSVASVVDDTQDGHLAYEEEVGGGIPDQEVIGVFDMGFSPWENMVICDGASASRSSDTVFPGACHMKHCRCRAITRYFCDHYYYDAPWDGQEDEYISGGRASSSAALALPRSTGDTLEDVTPSKRMRG